MLYINKSIYPKLFEHQTTEIEKQSLSALTSKQLTLFRLVNQRTKEGSSEVEGTPVAW